MKRNFNKKKIVKMWQFTAVWQLFTLVFTRKMSKLSNLKNLTRVGFTGFTTVWLHFNFVLTKNFAKKNLTRHIGMKQHFPLNSTGFWFGGKTEF